MRYIRVKGIVANPFMRNRRVELEFIADTGAIYTIIPQTIAQELGLEVLDKRKFKIASGEMVEYPVSEAYVETEGNGITSLVALAPEKTPTLLGVTTLNFWGSRWIPLLES